MVIIITINKISKPQRQKTKEKNAAYTSPNDLLALVVHPEPTDGITHLARLGPGDAVEEAADAGVMDYFLEGGNLWSLESDFCRV